MKGGLPCGSPLVSVLAGSRSAALGVGLDSLPELDLPRLLLRRLRHPDLEHAVAIRRADLILVDALRQAYRAAEAAIAALEAVEAIVRGLLRLLALGRHGQRVILDLDRDLVLRDARKVERVDDVVVGLPDVERGDPAPGLTRLPIEEARQPAVHVALERSKLPERLPTNECAHLNLLIYTLENIKLECFTRKFG